MDFIIASGYLTFHLVSFVDFLSAFEANYLDYLVDPFGLVIRLPDSSACSANSVNSATNLADSSACSVVLAGMVTDLVG